MQDVYITHAVRTPIGKIGGSLKDVKPKEMAALVIDNLVHDRACINTKEIDEIIFGEVRQNSESSNVARVASLLAGMPEDIPAYTVHRQCGSGLQSVMDAYTMIASGEVETVIAGGVESMSQSVYFMRNTKNGLGNGDFIIEDSLTAGGPGGAPKSIYGNLPMGITAENLAELYDISREEQDEFSQRSQERAANAIDKGYFESQIIPVELETKNGKSTLQIDEHPFLTSIEKLAKLAPVFKKGGTVTAGSSSGRNDGASAVLAISAEKAKALGYRPLVKILGIGGSGYDPKYMGLGPVESTKIALEHANLKLEDMDVIELNEAFAAQSLAVFREWEKWGVSREFLNEKVNPNGGAIALGHPLGCSGNAILVKCIYELLRVPENKYGLITLCCAGGQGVAVVVEKTGGDK